MYRFKSLLAVLCCLLVLVPHLGAQTPGNQLNPPKLETGGGAFSWITRPYRAPDIPAIDLANTNRLDSLLRAGKLYLSLQDAIALALENNLDISVQRYAPEIADANILRARAGGFLRGVSSSILPGPTSATQTGPQTGINQSAAQQASGLQTSGNILISQTGSPIPNLDPTIQGLMRWQHQTTPQTSTFVTGTNALFQRSDIGNFTYNQGFLTGTAVSLGYSGSRLFSNNTSADFNPATLGSLTFNFTQHLLQGFGVAVNSRQIHIAKNQRELSDMVFKQQVIETVSAVMNLYWDLVAFNQDVRVKQQALATSERLYNDNKKQVEIGTLAPIEIVRAEAEVASRQQDLTISETQVLQQETILKNALSKNGVASPSVAEAHLVPTDHITIPAVEPIQPIQDLTANALRSRPELSQSRIQVEDQKISIRGSRSALLPTLDLVANLNNNGLAGQPNLVPSLIPGRPRTYDPFFIGGAGTVLTQLFSRNFPDYGIGFNLNIPLRNRSARADIITDELTLRQQQISLQRQENQIRVEVQNAVIGVQQARARYQAAQKARVLQEQTVDAEQKKYELGASTIYNVILTQRDLLQAQSNEVAALSAYSKARVEMERATGRTLEKNNISLDEAFRGSVSSPP
ncbi:MAG: outer rane efflux protein, partial [Bryobacterales bacterium]|nr:outer rane efflux protein [Bryobacterales bacterium]